MRRALNRRIALQVLAVAGAAAVGFVPVVAAADMPSPQAPAASPQEDQAMSNAPEGSRPPPAPIAPVDYKGVRYEEDMDSFKHGGDQPGGYLKATDIATGKLLWTLKVYTVENSSPAGIDTIGMYFTSVKQGPGADQLQIENEGGGRYVVDLAARTSTSVYTPPAQPKLHIPQ